MLISIVRVPSWHVCSLTDCQIWNAVASSDEHADPEVKLYLRQYFEQVGAQAQPPTLKPSPTAAGLSVLVFVDVGFHLYPQKGTAKLQIRFVGSKVYGPARLQALRSKLLWSRLRHRCQMSPMGCLAVHLGGLWELCWHGVCKGNSQDFYAVPVHCRWQTAWGLKGLENLFEAWQSRVLIFR